MNRQATKNLKNTQSAKRKLLGGLAAATLGALLLAPQSGWLVRAQLRSAVGQTPALNYSLPSNAQNERAERAARVSADPKNRSDLGLQMAAQQLIGSARFEEARQAHGVTMSQERVDCLRPLLNNPYFGNRPEAWAAVLRYMAQDAVRLDERIETQLLTEAKPRLASQIADVQTKPNPNRNTPLALREWENVCREGERLDPDNAYFPAMHAIGLFAAHKDDEAVAALIAASRSSRYNEYTSEEAEGALRLNAQMDGKTGYISDLAVSAAQLFPHYSQIRQAGELATLYAMQREMAGQADEGFAIRQAVLRVGARMRVGATPMSGGWTGEAMGRTATRRPGGAPVPPLQRPGEDMALRKQTHRARFFAYLTRIGHEAAAGEFRHELEAGDRHREFWSRTENDPNNVLQLQPAYRLIHWWAVGVGVLTNLLVLLVLGGVCAAAAARNRRIHEGLPLSSAARSGTVSALAVPVFGLSIALFWPELPAQILTGVAATGLAVVSFRAFRHAAHLKHAAPQTQSSVTKSPDVRAFCLALGVTLLCALALGVLSQTGAPQLLRATNAMMGLQATQDYQPLKTFADVLFGVGAAAGVSLLLMLALTLGSRVRRVPVSVGVVRGMRRFALPVAALLAVVYAGVVVQTLREEAQSENALQTCLRNGEAAYLAGLLHETLPGRYSGKTASTPRPFVTIDRNNGPLSGVKQQVKAAK